MMRGLRIKGDGECYYHCLSRVVDRRFILGKREKEQFCKMMRAVERFCGVKVVTYAVMSNHFHILVGTPGSLEITDAELFERLEAAYPPGWVNAHRQVMEEYRKEGKDELAEAYRQRFLKRMGDVSEFMKMLKQRFSVWYNRQHDRVGTLWEDRFKSVLVEDGLALTTMAAYIDLNPVRAGMVSDPKDYRWSGYGEAVGGGEKAREGLSRVINRPGVKAAESWKAVAARYRQHVYLQGQRENGRKNDALGSEQLKVVLEKKGELSREELLRCRVRYFADGAVLGSREFVERVFERNRKLFGVKRRRGAAPMKGAWGGLMTARALRLEPITVPTG
ncbi:transposase [Kamptonema cortianum]|nr:transposase [Oscillatoria laete-virens]MDK3160315.1 transposase [Kamptonema cortianum]MDL5053696.1 transposase [Oscillatoria laete-virens NRMC-F 0139]